MEVKTVVSATKRKLGRAEALSLARRARRIIVCRGGKTLVFDRTSARPDEGAILRSILGPTGNLRAPALRDGDTLLIGFNEQTYREFLS